MSRLSLGVDIGGTFTDFVLVDLDAERIHTMKHLSTPSDPERGLLEGLAELAAMTGRSLGEITRFVHGTTIVTNAIIERRGVRTGLITTRGFRDMLEIGAERRFDLYDLMLTRPEQLVPRDLTVEVGGRLLPDGTEFEPLDEDELVRAAEALAGVGVEAIAISFIHAAADARHERRALELLEARFPEIAFTASHVVSPEVREYERTSTTAANGYVQPIVRRYLDRLGRSLRDQGLGSPFHLLLSNGGLASPERAATVPIQLIESGPAGGTIAAAELARSLGEPRVLAFDMGGTTAKMSLIFDGEPVRANAFETARAHRFKRGSGIPLRVPVIDLIEIGAGGGSIAWIDNLGLLRVGPESAGADPGPAAYGRGGTHPTVTDADILLGHLSPDAFLGGRMTLDVEAAQQAILDEVGAPLGMNAESAAKAVARVVGENMAIASRMYAAELGVDLSEFTMVAFGGAGPVHALHLAHLLRMRRVVFPAAAGTLASLGFLQAEPRFDGSRAHVALLDTVSWDRVEQTFAELEAEARQALAGTGVDAEEIAFQRSADLRYRGQGHEVRTPWPDGAAEEPLAAIAAAFENEYRALFGMSLDAPVEVVGWRLTATGPRPRTVVRSEGGSEEAPERLPRRAYFADVDDFVEAEVVPRRRLTAGSRLAGPMLIEDVDSTIVIGPTATITVDNERNVIVELAPRDD